MKTKKLLKSFNIQIWCMIHQLYFGSTKALSYQCFLYEDLLFSMSLLFNLTEKNEVALKKYING